MKLSKYNIVRTLDDLTAMDETIMDQLSSGSKLIAIDTETNGLCHWKDVVIGVSISLDSKSGFYIPFLYWCPDTSKKKNKKVLGEIYPEGNFKDFWTGAEYPENVTQSEYKPPEWMSEFLHRWIVEPAADLIMHNAPFDCLMIENNFGVDLSENVFCDTLLLKHILDENTSCSLKETALLWQKELGFSAENAANKEQIEIGNSVQKNGGIYNKRRKWVWRADLEVCAEYAIADTFLTYGVFEVGMEKLLSEYEEKHVKWFFEDEVMPLCKEVVIPMKRNGVRIDVPHFKILEQETAKKLVELEDKIIAHLKEKGYLEGFTKGSTIAETVTPKKLIAEIIQLEGLAHPIAKSKKGNKPSLAKKAVEDAYNTEPHWLWGYILGYNVMAYPEERLNEIKADLYQRLEGRKYQFNIGSDFHLRWLFCTKLGYDASKLPQTDSATKKKIIPSMKAEVLREYFLKDHEFVKWLLLYNKLDKLYGTYILPAVNLHHNGYLYMDMMQHGTTSGRFSCGGGFNLQTLPKVEEIDRCKKCESKNIETIKPIKLLATVKCKECGHVQEDILCPSVIKEGFIAPKGMKIVNADYSSLEPRCFSEMSGDPKLKEIFLKGLDFYSKVYCDVEDKEGRYSPDPKAPNFLKKVEPAKRNSVKGTALGIPYGARAPQTANLMGYRKMTEIRGEMVEVLDIDRGKAFRDEYLSTYSKLKGYMDKQEASANKIGYVETLIGRRRHFKFAPLVYRLLTDAGVDYEDFIDERRKKLQTMDYKPGLDKDALTHLSNVLGFSLFDAKKQQFRDWSFIRSIYKNELNNAKNMPVQGLGAHITNRAMLDIAREYKRKGLKAWVCLQVHDELTSYGEDGRLEEIREIVQKAMENNMYTRLLDIPMIAEPVTALTLKDAK